MYILKILLLIILVIIFYFTLNLNNNIENFDNIWLYYNKETKKPGGGLGNIFSVFFTSKTKNIVNDSKEVYELNKSEKNFIQLEKYFDINNAQKEKLKLVKYFNGESQWNFFKLNTLNFWKILKPNINISLNKFFEDIKIPKIENIPILHFRCSDVPFVLHNDYHFSKYKYYKWCNDKLKNKHKKWYIMYNNNHLSNEKYKKLSTIYFDDLKKYLIDELKIEIELLPNLNMYQDMKLLYNSTIVIQGGCGGSFSFFGGFFNGDYYCTNVNLNENSDLNLNSTINELNKLENIYYYDNGILYHKEVNKVNGYDNTSDVIKLLRN